MKRVDTQLQAVHEAIGRLYAGWGPDTGIDQVRRDWDAFFAEPRVPARVTPADAGGVPACWIEAPGATRAAVVLFLHGGGYQIGSHVSHHNLMAGLSARTGCAVLGVNYRLAPEHRQPAALQDCIAAHAWLLAQGLAPARIALCGDSAGGALAVLLMAWLRDTGAALPCTAVLMSPWVDLQAGSDSYTANAATDPVTQRAAVLRMARSYLGREGRPDAPEVSALHAALQGLPALLVQAGRAETPLGDALALAHRARAAGVPVRLSLWDGMPHVFQLFAGRLEAADAAIDEAAQHLAQHLGRTPHGVTE